MLVFLAVTGTLSILALLRWTRLPGIVVGLIGTIGGALVSAVVTLGFPMLVRAVGGQRWAPARGGQIQPCRRAIATASCRFAACSFACALER